MILFRTFIKLAYVPNTAKLTGNILQSLWRSHLLGAHYQESKMDTCKCGQISTLGTLHSFIKIQEKKLIMKPISYYYSSRNHPMPTEIEQWIERLPVAHKIMLATAIMRQAEYAFREPSANTLTIVDFGGNAS